MWKILFNSLRNNEIITLISYLKQDNVASTPTQHYLDWIRFRHEIFFVLCLSQLLSDLKSTISANRQWKHFLNMRENFFEQLWFVIKNLIMFWPLKYVCLPQGELWWGV